MNGRKGSSIASEAVVLGKLLEAKSGLPFKIPFFQRSYVWEEDEWERFLVDMRSISDAKEDYLMGAIILKFASASTFDNKKLIIDGQQRLTTILLFLKAIKWEGVKERLTYESGGLILEHSHNDKDIFEKVMKDELSDSLRREYRESRILQCYEYFKKEFEDEKNKIKDIDVDAILDHTIFISISLTDAEDEQQIFDTMNSLGISLTNGELLKNELYKGDNQELYEDTWKRVFENSEEQKIFWNTKFGIGRNQRTYMDILLQTYLFVKSYNYASGQLKKGSTLFKGYKRELLDKDEAAREVFIRGLMEYAKEYKNNITAQDKDDALDDKKITQRLNIIVFGLKIITAIPYILYILREVDDREEQAKIFKLLETYLMRRAIIRATTKDYNKYFMRHIHGKRNTYEKLRENVYRSESETSRIPDNRALSEAMINNRPSSTATAKVILYFLEHHARPDLATMQQWPISKYSIEHVMPTNWGKAWENDGHLFPEERRARKRWISTLGNLTLLPPSLNTSLGNMGWEEKKGKMEECCKDIATFSVYLEKQVWNEEVIKGRGEYLFNLAKDLWPYDPPKQF